MSSSGITPINSGPLLIRTYLDDSPNDTYILTDYDLPIPSNYVLITSTNGLLVPSNSVYLSTVVVSSLSGSSLILSTIKNSYLSASTLSGSTATLASISTPNIYGSTIHATTITIASSITAYNLNTPNIVFSNLVGSTLNTDQLFVGIELNASTSNGTFNSISFTTLACNNTLTSNNITTNQLSLQSISSNMVYNNTFVSTVTTTTSSLITSTFSYIDGFGGTQQLSTFIASKSIICSTIGANNITLTYAVGNSPSSLIIANAVIVSSLAVSTMTSNTISYSTLNGTTMTTPQLNVSLFLYSTMNISTITTSTLNASTVNVVTLYHSTTILSTLNISNIICLTCSYSSMTGNILTFTSTMYHSLASYLTLYTSTINTSTLSASSINFTIMNTPILLMSSLGVSTSYGSTVYANTSAIGQLFTSTVVGSNLFGGVVSASTLITPLLSISTAYGSTASISTLLLSSINTMTIGQGKGGNMTNTVLGYGSLANNTGSNNTAFGYTSLGTIVGGSNNTGLGCLTLNTNTTGLYNTAIGFNAGTYVTFTGSYNTYVGYQASPSNAIVSNEIVIGGSNTNGGSNTGNGSNSATLGNPAITYNRIYGSVGIGTNNPQTTLDVRGNFYLYSGAYYVTNSQPTGASNISLFNDSAISSLSLFLNGASASSDGTANSATLRNNYGNLRLQGGASGYNTAEGATLLATGMIGINTASPLFSLDVVGGIHATSNTSAGNTEVSYNSTITVYAPGGITSDASIWMGYDPTNDCGFINSARSGAIRPINFQTRTGTSGNPYVGIGSTYNPAYTLDVRGAGNFTTTLTTGTNRIDCSALTINGTTVTIPQWSGAIGTTITYNHNVTVTGIVTAGSYTGLPNGSGSTRGILTAPGTGLNATSGLLSIGNYPYFSGKVNGVASGKYLYSNIVNNGFTYNNTTGSLTPTKTGYYLVTLNGAEAVGSVAGIDTLTIMCGTSQYSVNTSGIGNRKNPATLAVIFYIDTNYYPIYVQSANSTYDQQQVNARWLHA